MCKKLKICLIGKYPPAKGGTASSNYWLAKTLSYAGHEVYIVTDFSQKESYLEKIPEKYKKEYQPSGVKIFYPKSDHIPKFFPYKSHIDILSGLAVYIVRKYNVDIIDSKYLFPYCWSGFIAKIITKKPLIVRHAGSDITYLMKNRYLRPLIEKVLKNADKIAIDPKKEKELLKFGIEKNKFIFETGFGISHKFFSEAKPINISKFINKNIKGIPIITSLGKMYKYKGIVELVKAASLLKNLDFFLLFIPEKENDKKYVKNIVKKYNLEEKTIFLDYQPPWLIPSIYKASTCVVCVEHNHPVYIHTPLVAIEALHAGACVIVSNETFRKQPFNSFKPEKNIIVVDPTDIKTFSEKLRDLIQHPEKAKKIGNEANKMYFDYNIKKLVKIYYELIG
ncbi:MAG: glycosyltransferase family 4 protein [Candidatus Aenigmarchaeota archaeon]|nr:glycosyltransferase family 4 protein [Candidatus Aenigmarchaeota archaeon]